MKTNDIALALVVAIFSFIASYVVGGWILGNPDENYMKIDFATEIASTVTPPAPEVFNPYALNPTVEVRTGTCPAGQVWDEISLTCIDEKEDEDNPETPVNPETPENPDGGGGNTPTND